jgi:hypothetical protein
MADRPWGERHHQPASSSSCRTPAAARRCLRRPRIALPLVIALFVFLALNPTVGRLWRGVHSCASQRWASLNDHQYELGESIHTLQSLGFRPQSVLDIGANEGNWVTGMRAKLPDAKFFCVEGSRGWRRWACRTASPSSATRRRT